MIHFSNLQLMKESRHKLSPHAGLAVLVSFIYVLLLTFVSIFENEDLGLFSLLISGPLGLGMTLFSLTIHRQEDPQLNQLFEGFQSFLKSFLAYLSLVILIILGILFFIIPGIIISLGFSMTFYVMAERPELSFIECMGESWNLMQGYKLKFLGLWLRFVPWYILGFLCFGVGVLLVIPWNYVAIAAFYEAINKDKEV